MNTQRQGILTDCETKQSQKGNIYHRMDIKEHGADRATWYTYFGNLDASHRGQEIRYVLKESRDGTPIVDSYELAEPGMAPPPPVAAPHVASAPSASTAYAPAPKLFKKNKK